MFPPWSTGDVLTLLGANTTATVLSRSDRPADIVGTAVAQVAADEAELLALCVLPQCRGIGIAWRMLDLLGTTVAGRGARTLHLEVAETNAPALRLYRRSGFVETGRRKGYYRTSSGKEDAVLMSCRL
jgi:ribosomal-protein-alanine N-acetyltransferase